MNGMNGMNGLNPSMIGMNGMNNINYPMTMGMNGMNHINNPNIYANGGHNGQYNPNRYNPNPIPSIDTDNKKPCNCLKCTFSNNKIGPLCAMCDHPRGVPFFTKQEINPYDFQDPTFKPEATYSFDNSNSNQNESDNDQEQTFN